MHSGGSIKKELFILKTRSLVLIFFVWPNISATTAYAFVIGIKFKEKFTAQMLLLCDLCRKILSFKFNLKTLKVLINPQNILFS